MHILSARPGSVTTLREEDGKGILHHQADVTALVERCKALHNEGHDTVQQGALKGARLVGEYDPAVIEAWAQARGLTYADVMQDNAILRRMVNDPDLSVFRVHKGKL